jgi:hypothetical protein
MEKGSIQKTPSTDLQANIVKGSIIATTPILVDEIGTFVVSENRDFAIG